MYIVLVGPVDYWWNENWETPAHFAYMDWRKDVNQKLVEAGHLVYRPWEAFKGAWDERGQAVNDMAIDSADIMINLCPPGIPAYGTAAEVERFRKRNAWKIVNYAYFDQVPPKDYFEAPPGDYSRIEHLIVPLDDPYGAVQRKSYTKGCGCP